MLLNFVCVEFQQIVCQIVYNHQPHHPDPVSLILPWNEQQTIADLPHRG